MEISKQLSRNIYIIFFICIGGGSYLYTTKYVGGDVFIGVCTFAVTGVFALMLYNMDGAWFTTYALPALNLIIVFHRQRNKQPDVTDMTKIPIVTVDEQTETDIPASDLITDIPAGQKCPYLAVAQRCLIKTHLRSDIVSIEVEASTEFRFAPLGIATDFIAI